MSAERAVQGRTARRRRVGAGRLAALAAATVFACWLPFQLARGDVGLYDRMGLYALVAIGLTLLMGFAGQVSLGQGGFFLIGAYTSGLLTVGLDPDTRLVDPEAGIDPLLAVAIAPLVSAGVAVVIGIPLMRLRGHYLAFATLAFALIAWSLLYAQDRFTGGQYGVTVTKQLVVGGQEISGATHAAAVWGLVGLALLLSTNLVSSRMGRALQAIAVNEPAAAASGINVALYKLQLFVFAAAMAGLAGGLFTFYAQFLGPEDFGIIVSLLFVVMVSIGGLGSVYGAVVGAVTIVFVEHKLRELGTHESLLGWDLPSTGPSILSLGVFGLLLITIMLFFPHGLLPGVIGAIRSLRRRLGASRASS
jgi:branched-chain amino acid transport system permease protein